MVVVVMVVVVVVVVVMVVMVVVVVVVVLVIVVVLVMVVVMAVKVMVVMVVVVIVLMVVVVVMMMYSTIADKVSEIPANTSELVALIEYLRKSSDITVFRLRRQLRDANEDIKLNSNLFLWPEQIEDVFENSRNLLLSKRDQAEMDLIKSQDPQGHPKAADTGLINRIHGIFLKAMSCCSNSLALGCWMRKDEIGLYVGLKIGDFLERQLQAQVFKMGLATCSEFESRLEGYSKELDTFRKREVMTTEEMKNNVEKLNELSKNLELALTEFELINKEEELLDKEKSSFPLLQTLMTNKVPFEQLWVTAYEFSTKSEEWMNGPLFLLNAEEIAEDIGNMWRTTYKLTKTLLDMPAPKRLAENVKLKIEKFKQHIPILNISCNPGMKDRHWQQVLVTPV
ncbi:hypothetical protein A6R68_08672 [Neotoma lepida]|uniref:Dynein heavy chain linker domain-containing protein n=1 Tax=Neotoma lepida TaxID=56216 RepID=A0A1A6G491_NEOLE|nr:hypothetical protein A6R68_08672 [Neotoma lepida]